MTDKQHKKAINSWAMYDWANSAFATTIMAAVLPVYYSSVAASTIPAHMATAYWGYTTSFSALLIAVISPLLGAMADFSGRKKQFLTFFLLLGVFFTALLYFIKTGDYLLASFFFIFANMGFSGSLVYYDALLPHVASPDEIDQVSAKGYALGYIGGGTLLLINLIMIMVLPKLIPGLDSGLMSRLSFVTVAVWWLIFSIPLLRNVSEPERRIQKGEEKFNPMQASFHRLKSTVSEIRKYRDLGLAMLAFWVYANGIGTIISMATIYATELGFSQITTIGTLLLVQFLAAPFAFLFGWLSRKIGTLKSIFISLSVYIGIAISGYFLYHEWQFWALGAAVATVQGGSQALSRSLIGKMMPKSKSAEFYGFFSVSEKFATVLGPLLFGIVGTIMKSSRLSIVSLLIFFAIGMFLLSKVNLERGIEAAKQEEASLDNARLN